MTEQVSEIPRMRPCNDRDRLAGNRDGVGYDDMQGGPPTQAHQLFRLAETFRRAGGKNQDM